MKHWREVVHCFLLKNCNEEYRDSSKNDGRFGEEVKDNRCKYHLSSKRCIVNRHCNNRYFL